MKRLLNPWIVSLILAAPLSAQVEVNGLTSFMAGYEQSTSATRVIDHLVNDYESYVGELIIVPTDPAFLGSAGSNAPGLIYGDSGGPFSGVRGLAGFCIDYNTAFDLSQSPNSQNPEILETDRNVTFSYSVMGYVAANSRYTSNVSGGLLKAAFLLDTNYEAAHAAGENAVGALQAAIWEVLYDLNPNISNEAGNNEAGNYYVLHNSVNNPGGAQVISTANQFLANAAAANWGGAGYNPDSRVIFWVDPESTDTNQGIITLNPFLVPIPEPSVCTLLAGFGILFLRRRRS